MLQHIVREMFGNNNGGPITVQTLQEQDAFQNF